MQQIEIAIGQDDAFPGAPPLLYALAEFLAPHNLAIAHLYCFQSLVPIFAARNQ
jgi:hypothetical protein